MRQAMIRYTVRPDQVERNLELVRGVFEELTATQPDGFRYATFQLEDEVSFVHVAFVEHDPGPLPELESFRRFLADLGERCDGPPVLTDFTEVGSFRLP